MQGQKCLILKEMTQIEDLVLIHPMGEGGGKGVAAAEGLIDLDTFAGKVQVQWEPDSSVTALGQMVFFIQFLKAAGNARVISVPLPQFVNSDLRQLRDVPNVTEFVPGDTAELVLNGSHSLFEPYARNRVSITVHGSDADGNDRFLLRFGQLFVVEGDDDNAHTAVRRNQNHFRFWCPGPSLPFP